MSKFFSKLRTWVVVAGVPFLAACSNMNTLPFLNGTSAQQTTTIQKVGNSTFVAPSGLCFDGTQTRKGFGKVFFVAKRCKGASEGQILTYTVFTRNAPKDIQSGLLHPKSARLVSDEMRDSKRFVVYEAQQIPHKNLQRTAVRGARVFKEMAILVTHFSGKSSPLSVSQRSAVVNAGLSQITSPESNYSTVVKSEPMLRPKIRPSLGG